MTRTPEQAIVVTHAALETYCRARSLAPAEATRELLGLLVGRELREEEGRRLPRVRARSRTLQVDVSAQIMLEGPLLLVVAVRVTPYL